jgi:DNA-binding HxlR family transcriptional regulator
MRGEDDTMTENEGEDEPLNEVFEVLSHEYRRYILWALTDPERRPGDAVEAIHFADFDGEPDILHLQLRHRHLPKLDDYGFVDWDPETGTLTRGPRFEEIEPFLDMVGDEYELPRNWP